MKINNRRSLTIYSVLIPLFMPTSVVILPVGGFCADNPVHKTFGQRVEKQFRKQSRALAPI